MLKIEFTGQFKPCAATYAGRAFLVRKALRKRREICRKDNDIWQISKGVKMTKIDLAPGLRPPLLRTVMAGGSQRRDGYQPPWALGD